jgi:hypothetical protein
MGLRDPLWLWLGALAVPLVLLYVLKVRRERQEVASTMLWRRALEELDAQTPFRRLRRNWLLLLQLAALALCVLAAAGPHLRTLIVPGARVAIVLDASASMLAGGRMEQARREALRLIDGMGARDEAAVVRAGSSPRVAGPLTADRPALRNAVRTVEASAAPADLEAALRLARSLTGDEAEIILVTDVSGRAPEGRHARVLRVGEALDNAGIVALGVRAANPSGLDSEIFVRVRNASERRVSGTLRLLVDGRLRDASALTIAAEREAARTFSLVGVARGSLEVEWDAETADAQPVDDSAGWLLVEPEPRTYRVHGEPDPYVAQALTALEGWRRAGGAAPADLELLVARSPEGEGPPFLWIDPPDLRRGYVESASVLEWDATHPVLRYADLHPVRLARTPLLARAPGARVLARSTAGPLILEGTWGERRYVVWGFQPTETDLPLHVAFPVLMHNALEHLAPPARNLPGGVATGQAPTVTWPEGEDVELIAPSGRTQRLTVASGVLRMPPLDEVGTWRVKGERRELACSASLLDEREADLRPQADGSVPHPGPSAARAADAATPAVRDLWRLAVLAGLAIVVLEGWAFHRRWLA